MELLQVGSFSRMEIDRGRRKKENGKEGRVMKGYGHG